MVGSNVADYVLFLSLQWPQQGYGGKGSGGGYNNQSGGYGGNRGGGYGGQVGVGVRSYSLTLHYSTHSAQAISSKRVKQNVTTQVR